MSKAAELAALIGSQTALSNRNLIINGDFQVWQRSTSSSSTGYSTADRWNLNLSGGSATASQGTFTDGQTAVPGNPRFYMALNVTTGNDNCGWQYRREGTWQFANDVYTLSFWAKSATPRVMTVSSDSYDASADVNSTHTVSPSTFTPTSSWQKFTFKITHSDMSGMGSYDNADWTRIGINQGSDTSTAAWKLDLALVQLEKGEQATPFEHRSFDDELYRCQRYFIKAENIANQDYLLTLQAYATSGIYGTIAQFPRLMRTTPSVGQGGSFGAYGKTSADASMPTTINSFQSSDLGWKTGGWVGSAVFLQGGGAVVYWQNGAYMTADAEL